MVCFPNLDLDVATSTIMAVVVVDEKSSRPKKPVEGWMRARCEDARIFWVQCDTKTPATGTSSSLLYLDANFVAFLCATRPLSSSNFCPWLVPLCVQYGTDDLQTMSHQCLFLLVLANPIQSIESIHLL